MPALHKALRPDRQRIVLFVEEGGGDWHARKLVAAFSDRDVDVVTTTLKDCAFDTRSPTGLDIPGFDGVLPDGAFVRAISTGGLEQITFRLGILHALREHGVLVWNDARAIERCVDKSTATFLFQKAGLPVPTTRVVETRARAIADCQSMSAPYVVKPLFGSQGNGVMRAETPDAFPASNDVGDVYYVQPYLRAADAASFADVRVFVSQSRVIATMKREGRHWVTNVHKGGTPAPIALTDQMSTLALAASEAVGVAYAGVDLIEDPGSGALLVLEINSNPAWKGLHKITNVDIASVLAQDFVTALHAQN